MSKIKGATKPSTEFTVHGPFEVPRDGRLIDRDSSAFWDYVGEDISCLNGCYIFAVRSGQNGITPWYAGKTTRAFHENECFADHKVTKYDRVLQRYNACTPLIFFVSCSRKNAKNKIRDVEKFLIDLVASANPDSANNKDVSKPSWFIGGVTQSNGQGNVPNDVLKFRKALNLKPPRSGGVKKLGKTGGKKAKK